MERVAQDEKQDTEKARRRANTAGQIIPRGGDTWLVRIFMGRDGQGKRRYLNKTIKGKKKDAQDYLSKTLTAISAGTFVEPSPLTVGEYLDKWLESAARPRLRERTLSDYKDKLDRYVRPLIGGKRLCDVRPLDIQALCTHLISPKLKKDETPQAGIIYGLGLSARTVRYAHAVVSSAFKQAVKWQMLANNPCAAVELPRHARREMHAFSQEEAARFLKAADVDECGIIFAFALVTGMRPEEYLGLKWSDVDLDKGTATVRRTLVRRKGGGWYFGEPKTSRSRRTVPLPSSIVRALHAHRRAQAENRLKLGPFYQNNELVFATGEGTPHNLRNLTQRHFQPALTRAKLPLIFRLYDLRHSCATLLLQAGENPKVVSERLGHASIVLTLDTYSHVLPSMQQAATEKLESILFKKTRAK
jgi:integrase